MAKVNKVIEVEVEVVDEVEVIEDTIQEVETIPNEVNVQIDEMIQNIFAKQIELDNSKINLFVFMIDLFKASQNKDKLEEVLLKRVDDRAKENSNITKAYTNKVKNIVKICKLSVIYDLYLFEGRSTNIMMYFYNIEKMTRLFDYLYTNYTQEEALLVRKDLNALVVKAKDKKEYNDVLAKSLSDLFKKYKIVLSDSGAIVKVSLTADGIASFLKTLTPEQVEMVLNQALELDKVNKNKAK